jgi:hypothetical protein
MAAFSKPLSTLEHRILRMTDRERGPRWIKRGVLLAGVTAMLAGTWVLPTPPPLEAWQDGGCCCGGTASLAVSAREEVNERRSEGLCVSSLSRPAWKWASIQDPT